MDIGQISIIGIVATLLVVLLKEKVPSMALVLSLATCVLIFIIILPQLAQVMELIQNFSTYISYKKLYLDVILKIIGIAYISDLSSGLCMDAGERAIASKIEMAGKILIIIASIPIINEIFSTVIAILPSGN